MNKKLSLLLLFSLYNAELLSAAPKIGRLAKLTQKTKIIIAFAAGYYIKKQDTENILNLCLQ